MTFQPYRSPSTGCEVRAVLFDTFGTVVDWRTGVARQAVEFAATHGQDLDAEAFADDWRALYQPAMEAIRSGSREFATLDTLHRENLDQVLRRHGYRAELFTGFDPDWDAPFARALGPIFGPQVARVLREGLAQGTVIAKGLARDSAEYLTEERRDLVAKAELEAFYDDVDALRERVERLVARVGRVDRDRAAPGGDA